MRRGHSFSYDNLFFVRPQHRFLLGGRVDVIRADHREDGGPAGSKLGGRRVARRDSVLARGDAIRGDVRPDCARVDLHDPGVRRRVQRRHRLGYRADDTAGTLRHVLR